MAIKYLSYFPKPVLDDLVSGRWLPIVGAGMSLNAELPAGEKMPLWGDLGTLFENDLSGFSSANAIDAISAYEHEFSRPRLIERLSDFLHIRSSRPGNSHKEFCSIQFDIVCTTNFDFLLELGFQSASRYFYPIVDEEQLSTNLNSAGTTLLKLHGDIHHPSRLVVTESDYDGFLSNYPLIATYLSNLLITRTAILIGYSLDDPDFRQIWHTVTQRLGRSRRMAYAIAVGAKPGDISRYARRGVTLINLPGSAENYGEVLASLFREIREYWRDNIFLNSAVTEEKPLRELLLPRESASRLCFFSLPLNLVSLYRASVFPEVERAGFIPITAADVITPGDNISAKIDALIDRSAVVVVEPYSEGTLAEFRMAVSKIRAVKQQREVSNPFELIVVAKNSENFPEERLGVTVIRRNGISDVDWDMLSTALGGHLTEIASARPKDVGGEAKRLFDTREYRAAVIAAMTLLESFLRSHLDDVAMYNGPSLKNYRRIISMRALVDRAHENQIITSEEYLKIIDWINIRNNAVHTTMGVSRSIAQRVVGGVGEILERVDVQSVDLE